MSLIEKFTSFDDFNLHFRNIFDHTIKIDEHIYYMLFYSKDMTEYDTVSMLRDYYRNPSPAERELLRSIVRNSYRAKISAHSSDAFLKSNQDIDSELALLMNGDDVHGEPYPTYLFPWPRAKFADRFYSQIFPSFTRHYTDALAESGHFTFKKAFTVITDRDFSQDLQDKLMIDPTAALQSINITQTLSDIQSNILFYKNHYEQALLRNQELLEVIDQMSEQINANSLTRWY